MPRRLFVRSMTCWRLLRLAGGTRCSAGSSSEGTHAGQFLAAHHRRVRRGDDWTIRQLIEYLRDVGCIPTPPRKLTRPPRVSWSTRLGVPAFRARSSVSTLANYLPIARSFLDEQFGGKGLHFDDLRVVDIHRFIVRRARPGSRGRATLVVTAFRSFLRFLQQRGIARDRSRRRRAWGCRLALGAPAESAAR